MEPRRRRSSIAQHLPSSKPPPQKGNVSAHEKELKNRRLSIVSSLSSELVLLYPLSLSPSLASPLYVLLFPPLDPLLSQPAPTAPQQLRSLRQINAGHVVGGSSTPHLKPRNLFEESRPGGDAVGAEIREARERRAKHAERGVGGSGGDGGGAISPSSPQGTLAVYFGIQDGTTSDATLIPDAAGIAGKTADNPCIKFITLREDPLYKVRWAVIDNFHQGFSSTIAITCSFVWLLPALTSPGPACVLLTHFLSSPASQSASLTAHIFHSLSPPVNTRRSSPSLRCSSTAFRCLRYISRHLRRRGLTPISFS